MPIQSNAPNTADPYLRMLVMGPPKVGKTTTLLATAPGPCYLINSDDPEAPAGARMLAPPFTYDNAFGESLQPMQAALSEAAKGVADGRYKTIVWDTLSLFAQRLEEMCLVETTTKDGKDNPMKAYPLYSRHLNRILDRLFALKAHVIVTAHYLELKDAEGRPAYGTGIVPLLAGDKTKQILAARFNEVVFLTMHQGERIFLTSSKGAFGPAMRTLPGVDSVPADVTKLVAAIQTRRAKP